MDRRITKTENQCCVELCGRPENQFQRKRSKNIRQKWLFSGWPFPKEKDRVDLKIGSQQYFISKIYILAKEVIIQHEPITNGVPVSVRIPIVSAKPQNPRYTAIDRLLNNTPSVRFQINNLLNDGDLAALYAGGTAMYLEKGISIQTGMPEKAVENPYEEIGVSLFDPDYALVSVHLGDTSAVQEGFRVIEGLDPGDEYVDMQDEMECTPYDIGADNVQFLQVPIADETLSNSTDRNTMYGVLYLFYMGIIALAAAIFVPQMMPFLFPQEDRNNQSKQNSKVNFLVFLFLCLFMGSIFLTLDGSQRKNASESRAGLILFLLSFVFFCAIFSVIVFKQIIQTSAFSEDGWKLFQVFEFIGECFPGKNYGAVFWGFVLAFLIFCFFILMDHYISKSGISFTPYLFMWGVFFSIAASLIGCFIFSLLKFK